MASGLRPKTSGKIGLDKSLHKRGDQDVSADIRTRRLESFCVEEQCASLAENRSTIGVQCLPRGLNIAVQLCVVRL